MITMITATGFKGLSFEQPLERLTLFLGKNGSGKSARSQALTLALVGYIPGSGKANADILDTFGDGNKLVVGAQIGGKLFERGFVANGSSVGQGYKVDGKKASKDVFSHNMGAAGNPVCIDIPAFMALSDQKKIDFILDLYPPKTSIAKLVQKIEDAKAKRDSLQKQVESSKGAAATLVTSRSTMETPPGTLAEILDKITQTEAQLAQARQELADANEANAKEEGAALAIAAQQKKKDIEDAVKALVARAQAVGTEPSAIKRFFGRDNLVDIPLARLETYVANLEGIHTQKSAPAPAPETKPAPAEPAPVKAETSAPQPETIPAQFVTNDIPAGKGERIAGFYETDDANAQAVLSITAILEALDMAGCGACAARLVAVKELRKYGQGRMAA